MDGAAKFVRGDAIAGLMITFINIIGGIIIGVGQRGLGFLAAADAYTRLTVGDGLVTQVPALIVSTAAGIIVTKAGLAGKTEKALFAQLGGNPKVLGMSAGAADPAGAAAGHSRRAVPVRRRGDRRPRLTRADRRRRAQAAQGGSRGEERAPRRPPRSRSARR